MTLLRCLVTLQANTNLPEDRFQNQFWFAGTDSAGSMATNSASNLVSFYNTVHSPGVVAIAGFLSGQLNRTNGLTLTYYNMADTKPRAPINVSINNLGALSGTNPNLPSEVAACVSFQGAKVSGELQARRRGRVFIGPLNTIAQVSTSTTNSTLATGFNDALRGAATFLAAANTAGTYWAAHSTIANTAIEVTDGWVDNAFDTQRRRGLLATSRSTWT